MASRVMPVRAFALVGTVALALGVGLMTPVEAYVPTTGTTTTSGTIAPTTRTTVAVPTTTTAAVALPVLVRGEPLVSRSRTVPFTLRGVYHSAYIGSFYDPRYEKKRMCIVKRESSGYYTVKSSGGYYGAYQFNDHFRTGAPAMMYKSLAREVGPALAASLVAHLKATRINRWSRYWQDRAFWTVFNHGKGASNWAGGRWSC